MKLYSVGINLEFLREDETLEVFYDFLCKYGTKVIVRKCTDFIYTKENIEKEIKRTQSKESKKYCDLIYKSYYYSNPKFYNKKYGNLENFLKYDLWQKEEYINKENIDRIINESTNKTKEPSETTFDRIDRFFVIPNNTIKDEIIDYSIYNFDDKLKKYFKEEYRIYNPKIDDDPMLELYIINDDHLIAISDCLDELVTLYLTKEELNYFKNNNIEYDMLWE